MLTRVLFSLGAGSITAFSLYGHLFLTRLRYTQLQVNAVSIAAEIAMYLLVPLFGYLCDRYSPSPLALFSGGVFGLGYLFAALAYKSGAPVDAGGSGWPFWVMIVAFIAIGMGTSCMYLAAVATCAKNYGRGKHKGIMLAIPIAAFGLSGMWQSQIGTHVLYERNPDGSHGDVDVFRYFMFLAILLLVTGVIGTFALRIVDADEEKYIDETVEELERSGLLEESEFFQARHEVRPAVEYGTFTGSDDDLSITLSEEEREQQRREKEREEEERRKKNWLLNYETRVFLQDPTMWWLAAGFFLVTGPGESYINNVSLFESLRSISAYSYSYLARHDHSNPDSHFLCRGRLAACWSSFHPRHHRCTYINNRPSPHRLSVRLLRTPRNTPLPTHAGGRTSSSHQSNRHPPNNLPNGLPPPISLPPLNRLPNPVFPDPAPSTRHLPPHHCPSRLRLRQRLLPNPNYYLSGMGRRKLRHELGYRCHDACHGRRPLGRSLLSRLPECG